jgi:hypothetical protein
MAPGRFAASINQAPMKRRTPLLLARLRPQSVESPCAAATGLPPEHLLRQAFETCATFEQAHRLLRPRPVARPVLFLLVGCVPGERVIIERDGDRVRSYRDDTTIANDWQEARPGWRPRCCGAGTPVENNRRRRAALAAFAGRDAADFGWVAGPVLNDCTRLSVELLPATGRLVVAGWEPDGGDGVVRATAVTVFPPPCT